MQFSNFSIKYLCENEKVREIVFACLYEAQVESFKYKIMVGNLVTLSLYGLFQYHSDITSKLIPFMTLSCLLPTEKPIAKRKVFKDLTFDRTFIFLV